jgi:hypothetical protein
MADDYFTGSDAVDDDILEKFFGGVGVFNYLNRPAYYLARPFDVHSIFANCETHVAWADDKDYPIVLGF